MAQEKQQCSVFVTDSERGGWRRPKYQCTRKATVIEDGKPYCKQHSPAQVAERRQAQDARYKARWAADDERRAKEAYNAAAGDLCRSLGLEREQLTIEYATWATFKNGNKGDE